MVSGNTSEHTQGSCGKLDGSFPQGFSWTRMREHSSPLLFLYAFWIQFQSVMIIANRWATLWAMLAAALGVLSLQFATEYARKRQSTLLGIHYSYAYNDSWRRLYFFADMSWRIFVSGLLGVSILFVLTANLLALFTEDGQTTTILSSLVFILAILPGMLAMQCALMTILPGLWISKVRRDEFSLAKALKQSRLVRRIAALSSFCVFVMGAGVIVMPGLYPAFGILRIVMAVQTVSGEIVFWVNRCDAIALYTLAFTMLAIVYGLTHFERKLKETFPEQESDS
jgi:hypothetical protein